MQGESPLCFLSQPFPHLGFKEVLVITFCLLSPDIRRILLESPGPIGQTLHVHSPGVIWVRKRRGMPRSVMESFAHVPTMLEGTFNCSSNCVWYYMKCYGVVPSHECIDIECMDRCDIYLFIRDNAHKSTSILQ